MEEIRLNNLFKDTNATTAKSTDAGLQSNSPASNGEFADARSKVDEIRAKFDIDPEAEPGGLEGDTNSIGATDDSLDTGLITANDNEDQAIGDNGESYDIVLDFDNKYNESDKAQIIFSTDSNFEDDNELGENDLVIHPGMDEAEVKEALEEKGLSLEDESIKEAFDDYQEKLSEEEDPRDYDD